MDQNVLIERPFKDKYDNHMAEMDDQINAFDNKLGEMVGNDDKIETGDYRQKFSTKISEKSRGMKKPKITKLSLSE